jgi:hypothetical protein
MLIPTGSPESIGLGALGLDYSACVEQLEIARAEIIEINSLHSSTCSSNLDNDTCMDSTDCHDVRLI